jgi:hypothetical protein
MDNPWMKGVADMDAAAFHAVYGTELRNFRSVYPEDEGWKREKSAIYAQHIRDALAAEKGDARRRHRISRWPKPPSRITISTWIGFQPSWPTSRASAARWIRSSTAALPEGGPGGRLGRGACRYAQSETLSHNRSSFDLNSKGHDKTAGTEDDIVNWVRNPSAASAGRLSLQAPIVSTKRFKVSRFRWRELLG